MKTLLFAMGILLVLSPAGSSFAQDSDVSRSDKDRLNLEIDRRLGWIDQDWKVSPAAKTAAKPSRLPNYFAPGNSRFFQPGPPPYAQQPEYAEVAGLESIVLSGQLNDLPRQTQEQILGELIQLGQTSVGHDLGSIVFSSASGGSIVRSAFTDSGPATPLLDTTATFNFANGWFGGWGQLSYPNNSGTTLIFLP